MVFLKPQINLMVNITKSIVLEVLSRNANIRDVSRKTYTNVMNRISEFCVAWFGDCPYDIDSLVTRLETDTSNKHTLRLRYSTLAIFVKQLTPSEISTYFSTPDGGDILEKVSLVVKSTGNEVHQTYVQQKMTPSEKAKWKNWPEVERVWMKMIPFPKIPKDFDARVLYFVQEYALAGLYTVIPPVRNDYRTVRVDETSNANYITFDTSKRIATIVLNEYKTSKKYGSIKLQIFERQNAKHKLLYEALKALVDARKKLGDRYLFATQKGGSEPLTSPNFSHVLTSIYQKHLGKPLGSQMIRKIYLSYIQRDEPTLVEKQTTAAAMGHSTDMQALYRRLP